MTSDILLLEGFGAGSHRSFANNLKKFSSHNVEILDLPGRHWKWRMHGGAVTLAENFMVSDYKPDFIFATDMIDLSLFLSLTRERTSGIPAILYFHENQFAYPWSENDSCRINGRDHHYGFINYTSAISADSVLFNSRYNMDSFLMGAEDLLRRFPDNKNLFTIDELKKKSRVLHLGIDLCKFDRFKPESKTQSQKPLILWNHRWEHDKNPEDFFKTLFKLADAGYEFEVAVLGEAFRNSPKIFTEAENFLGDRIVKFGYAESFEEYANWLWRADILPVSSIQDFFGISIAEAMYCETIPVLPQRLSYPSVFLNDSTEKFFYKKTPQDLLSLLKTTIDKFQTIDRTVFRKSVEKFDWNISIAKYDCIFEKLISQ